MYLSDNRVRPMNHHYQKGQGQNPNYGDRQGFVVPFLVGALTGGAAIGLTRPRPIVSYPTYPQYYPPHYPPRYPYYY